MSKSGRLSTIETSKTKILEGMTTSANPSCDKSMTLPTKTVSEGATRKGVPTVKTGPGTRYA